MQSTTSDYAPIALPGCEEGPGGQRHWRVADLRLHPMAESIPRMLPDEWTAFLADVRERGVRDPIVITPAGVILDGRHRWEASNVCGQAEIPYRIEDIPEEAQALYIVTAALLRRHLTADQRAMLAVEWYEPLSEARRSVAGQVGGRAGGRGRPKDPDADSDCTESVQSLSDPPPRSSAPRTSEGVAAQAGVSRERVERARKLQTADPDAAEAVKAGTQTLREAEKQAVKETEHELLNSAGILDSAAVLDAELRKSWAKVEAYGRKNMLQLRPDCVVAVLDQRDRASARRYIEDCEAFFAVFRAELESGIKLVEQE